MIRRGNSRSIFVL